MFYQHSLAMILNRIKYKLSSKRVFTLHNLSTKKNACDIMEDERTCCAENIPSLRHLHHQKTQQKCLCLLAKVDLKRNVPSIISTFSGLGLEYTSSAFFKSSEYLICIVNLAVIL